VVRHPDRLLDVKRRVEERCGSEFNTVLLNLYRDGKDSVAWHSDDEPELGKEPVIASVSLGAERDFMLRRKDQHDRQLKLLLPHGSLLVMQGGTQADWEHCLPKRTLSGPRINLTFRVVQR
jgi:alkylated DNA repair dioxygenase AlkB